MAERKRGQTLTRDAIVDRALVVLERDGAGALSMRRLGDELGVDATAFYRHFKDKDELLLAAFDRVNETVAASLRDLPADLGWRDRLRHLAERSWEVAAQHPAVFSLCFARTTGGTAEREIVEFILATVASTELPSDQVVLHYRMFGDSTLAACGSQSAVAALDPALRERDANAWTRIYAVLPQSEYPAARAHATDLATVAERAIYDEMVEAILDRIEAAVTRAVGSPA